jgi:hypothetical protein
MKTVTWYIFNVLGKKKHVSPKFLEAGFEWHIEAYPNGIDDTCKGCDCDCCPRMLGFRISQYPIRFFSIGVFISAFPGFHTVLAKGFDSKHEFLIT